MERLAAAPDDVWSRFARIDDDTGDNTRELRLTLDDWDGLGQPDVLTVTVEPGDKLNDARRHPFTNQVAYVKDEDKD